MKRWQRERWSTNWNQWCNKWLNLCETRARCNRRPASRSSLSLSLSLPIRSWKNGKKHSSLIFPLLFLLLICFPPLWRLCSKLSDVRSPSGEQVWHVGRTEGNVTAMSRRDELISPFPFCSLSKTAHLYYSSHPLLATAELPPVFDRPVLIISKQSLFKFLKNLYQNSWLLSAFSPRWWKLSPWFVLF